MNHLYYTPAHGNGNARYRTSAVVGGDIRLTEVARASVLREAERVARLRGVRWLCRKEMSALLRARHGATQPGARSLLPLAADRVFRRPRLGTRHRVARDGLVGCRRFPAPGGGRSAARSFDDFSHAAPD